MFNRKAIFLCLFFIAPLQALNKTDQIRFVVGSTLCMGGLAASIAAIIVRNKRIDAFFDTETSDSYGTIAPKKFSLGLKSMFGLSSLVGLAGLNIFPVPAHHLKSFGARLIGLSAVTGLGLMAYDYAKYWKSSLNPNFGHYLGELSKTGTSYRKDGSIGFPLGGPDPSSKEYISFQKKRPIYVGCGLLLLNGYLFLRKGVRVSNAGK